MVGPLEALKIVGFPKSKIPKALKRTRELLTEQYPQIDTTPGIVEQLDLLRKQRVSIGILTSNNLENIEPFLTRHRLQKYFDFIHTNSSFFGKSKHIKKIIKTRGISPSHIVFIGDEVRDIDAARKAKVKSIAVTWGANHHKPLQEAGPTKVLDDSVNLSEAVIDLLG